MRLVKLHTITGGNNIYLNPEKVISLREANVITEIRTETEIYHVKESVDDVLKLFEDSKYIYESDENTNGYYDIELGWIMHPLSNIGANSRKKYQVTYKSAQTSEVNE